MRRREEVMDTWRASPTAALTVEVAEALAAERESGDRNQALKEVGRVARQLFPQHSGVLLAVARMYATAFRLIEARATLERALAIASTDPRVLALLAEVLLKLGHARAAVRALAPAIGAGIQDSDI